MSLLECPICGKTISDSLETCIHCGAKIVQCNKNKPFHFLSESRRKELMNEFLSHDVESAKFDMSCKKWDFIRRVYLFSLIPFFIYMILMSVVIYLAQDFKDIVLTIIALGIWVCALIINLIILNIISTKMSQGNVKFFKKLQIWLKQNKDIDLNLNLIGLSKDELKMIDEIKI